ncbi:MAG: SDR family oxidoreductase [Proteobacteria bacterium]|nr:SDR family oxidoreductase [Pseudomonadota bacterium]MBU1712053.1 SDR family oxidoreductase [Pseudomonadota bacterium]
MGRKVVLVTGASSGIGKAAAEYLFEKGHTVYGASRTVADGTFPFTPLKIDVDSDDSVNKAISRIINKEGKIDVVINCAGFGLAGSIEDTSVDEAKALFETNFFGVFRVCKGVIPEMRKCKSGTIINIGSLSGLISIPFQAFYSSSKFAIESLTEALRIELLPFGIRVVLIEPGDFHTGFTANRKKAAQSEINETYRKKFARAVSIMEKDELNGPLPVKIAKLIERLIDNPSPRLRYTTGQTGQRLLVKLRNILPHKITEFLLMKYYGLI